MPSGAISEDHIQFQIRDVSLDRSLSIYPPVLYRQPFWCQPLKDRGRCHFPQSQAETPTPKPILLHQEPPVIFLLHHTPGYLPEAADLVLGGGRGQESCQDYLRTGFQKSPHPLSLGLFRYYSQQIGAGHCHYPIQFLSLPLRTFLFPILLCYHSHESLLEKEAVSMLCLGALEEVPQEYRGRDIFL